MGVGVGVGVGVDVGEGEGGGGGVGRCNASGNLPHGQSPSEHFALYVEVHQCEGFSHTSFNPFTVLVEIVGSVVCRINEVVGPGRINVGSVIWKISQR